MRGGRGRGRGGGRGGGPGGAAGLPNIPGDGNAAARPQTSALQQRSYDPPPLYPVGYFVFYDKHSDVVILYLCILYIK